MRFRTILPTAVLLASLFATGAGGSSKSAPRYRVGIGDQHVAMFSSSAFQRLGLKRVRYLVPWDWQREPSQRAEVAAFLSTARSVGKEVFVTFTAARGCWVDNRYSTARHCRAPSTAAYRRSFRSFRAAYPFVKVFAPWNEVNHASQPTARSPRLAARYYNVVRGACRGCTIVAADVLDQAGVQRYLRSFRRFAKGSPRRWGLHNYSDVNRRRSSGTRSVLRTVPGEVWLTETGGVVKFGQSFPYSEARAAARTRYMFKLADRYSRRRSGLRSRLTRIYPYSWTGVRRGERFDAGMTDPEGSVRKAYSVFRAMLRTRAK